MSGLNPGREIPLLEGRIRGRRRPTSRRTRRRRSTTITRTSSPRSSSTPPVDGPAEIGSGEPFGVFVNLRHTNEIERRGRRVRQIPPEPEHRQLILLQLWPAAGELPRQVHRGRQEGPGRALRRDERHFPGREGELAERRGAIRMALHAVCVSAPEGEIAQGGQDPAPADRYGLPGYVRLRDHAGRVAGRCRSTPLRRGRQSGRSARCR